MMKVDCRSREHSGHEIICEASNVAKWVGSVTSFRVDGGGKSRTVRVLLLIIGKQPGNERYLVSFAGIVLVLWSEQIGRRVERLVQIWIASLLRLFRVESLASNPCPACPTLLPSFLDLDSTPPCLAPYVACLPSPLIARQVSPPPRLGPGAPAHFPCETPVDVIIPPWLVRRDWLESYLLRPGRWWRRFLSEAANWEGGGGSSWHRGTVAPWHLAASACSSNHYKYAWSLDVRNGDI
jgi:hypothetical protein